MTFFDSLLFNIIWNWTGLQLFIIFYLSVRILMMNVALSSNSLMKAADIVIASLGVADLYRWILGPYVINQMLEMDGGMLLLTTAFYVIAGFGTVITVFHLFQALKASLSTTHS